MRKLIISGLFIAISIGLFAQSNVIVVNASGKVEYQAKGQKESKRVIAGMQIPSSSTLKLNGGSKAKLLFAGSPIELNKKGRYDLKVLLEKQEAKKSRSFLSRFWNFINEGISNTSDDEKLRRYHQQYMEEATGGISGFGKDDDQIRTYDLVQGVLAESVVDFQWQTEEAEAIFTFEVFDSESNELQFSAMTRDSFLHMDFTNIYLAPKREYYWRVSTKLGEKLVQSEKKFFNVEPDTKQEILTTLDQIEGYELAEELEKQLMQSHVFEKEGLIYSSHSIYLELIHQYPENMLVKKLYKAFLARNNSL